MFKQLIITARRVTSPRISRAAFGLALVLATGCQGLLDVSDPTLVRDQDIATEAGANARRLNVVKVFDRNLLDVTRDVAVFTDERVVDFPNAQYIDENYYLDRRDSQGYETRFSGGSYDPHLGALDEIITAAAVAIPEVEAYTPDSLRGDFLGQLYAIRSYTILQMAEDVCPGFPINDIADNLPVYGAPLSTDSAVKHALAQIDSAIKYAHDSTRTVYMAQVLKGRALLDLGRYSEAAAAVNGVPLDFVYVNDGVDVSNYFFVQSFYWDAVSGGPNIQLAVGDAEGSNGMPFVSSQDPRVGTVFEQVRYNNPADSLYDQTKFKQATDPIVLASGIEAQLVQAEADLNAADPNWFTILNTLRATAIIPAMQPIAAIPPTKAEQVDLLYQERAFWLYLTGRRLGDLRRLIRNYGRSPEAVFPTGQYPLLGQVYSSATAIPFIRTAQQRFNSKITSGCSTR